MWKNVEKFLCDLLRYKTESNKNEERTNTLIFAFSIDKCESPRYNL